MKTFKDLMAECAETANIPVTERKFFKTRKRQIDKAKKTDKSKRKIKKRDAKVYYRRNKAKIKKNQKIRRRKVKARPSLVRRHRK